MNISTVLGITPATYMAPYLFYGDYAEHPAAVGLQQIQNHAQLEAFGGNWDQQVLV
jgi:hypothetical protein